MIKQKLSSTFQIWSLFWISIGCVNLGCQEPTESSTLSETTMSLPQDATSSKLNTWDAQRAEFQRIQALIKTAPTHEETHEEISYQALRDLNFLAQKFPTVASIIKLKRAELWARLGQWTKSAEVLRSLPLDDIEIQREAALSLLSYASQCEHLEEVFDLLTQQRQDKELIKITSIARLKYNANCKSAAEYQTALKYAAEVHPHTLSVDELLGVSSRLEPQEVITFAKNWEKERLPEVGIRALTQLLTQETLSENDRWEVSYQRERIIIERMREGFDESIETLQELIKYSGERGRRARLLLAKAFAKTGQEKQAIKVYQELINEWKFSEEAKTARFNSAFLFYERGEYQRAVDGFAELCRHRGKSNKLSRFAKRAQRGSMTQNAEWYYAWNLYLLDPSQAAPFLEAQIGDGLPVTLEGRRATYWAARALENTYPERAARYRAQLLEGHWGDWYSLLLRAADPSIATDIKPWPALPSFNPPHRSALGKTKNETETPLVAQLELIIQRAEIAEIFGFNDLQDRYLKRARSELRALLRSQSQFEPELVAWGQHLDFHRELLSWALTQKKNHRLQTPELSEAKWWMLLYPRAFNHEVESASKATGVSQIKLLSFIYKESAFEARAISHAYAMGLMQLLEKTAQALHPKAPLPDLLQPKQNVQLGAEYLSALSARFQDQLPIVAAAYNAGPTNVITWIERHKARDQRKLDHFVEEIPFKEARNYVKQLVSLYCAYALIYDQLSINQCAASLPLTLSMNVAPGVSF